MNKLNNEMQRTLMISLDDFFFLGFKLVIDGFEGFESISTNF